MTPPAKPSLVETPAALPLPRLIAHFVSRINYEVLSGADADANAQARFGVGGLLIKDPSQPQMRELRLQAEINGMETTLKLLVEVVAQVDGVSTEGDVEAIDRHVLLCVAPTLLSAVREQVISLTARTVIGTPVLMPLMPIPQLIGSFTIQTVTPTAEGEASKP
jgi:hypothetical protein